MPLFKIPAKEGKGEGGNGDPLDEVDPDRETAGAALLRCSPAGFAVGSGRS